MVRWPYLKYSFSYVIKFCWWSHGQKLWCHNLYFKIPFLRKPRVVNFADFIKIAIMFIKITFKDSKKVKQNRKYILKCNLYLYFLNITKVTDFRWKNADVTRTQGVRHMIYMFFIFFRKSITVPSFIIVGYVWQI